MTQQPPPLQQCQLQYCQPQPKAPAPQLPGTKMLCDLTSRSAASARPCAPHDFRVFTPPKKRLEIEDTPRAARAGSTPSPEPFQAELPAIEAKGAKSSAVAKELVAQVMAAREDLKGDRAEAL